VAKASPVENKNFILPHRQDRSAHPAHIRPSNVQRRPGLIGEDERVQSPGLARNRRGSIRQRSTAVLAHTPASSQPHKPNDPAECNPFHHTPVPPAPGTHSPGGDPH
jgi:hypothetical protein